MSLRLNVVSCITYGNKRKAAGGFSRMLENPVGMLLHYFKFTEQFEFI